MKTVLVTGANGQLGNALRRLAPQDTSLRFLFTDVDQLDICLPEAVHSFVAREEVDYIVNCAAYTAVDKAEEEPALCRRINCAAVATLGEAARQRGARMIHVSTDYVFDGTNHLPYRESDRPCPVSVYGQTKLDGEQALFACCPEAVVIRTAWLYSEFGSNFVKTVLRLAATHETLRFIYDQVGTPTYAGDLAAAILRIVAQAEAGQYHPGVYHYAGEGVCSWYDFTVAIVRLAGLTTQVCPIETSDFPTRAQRPHYSVLNKQKIKETYGLRIPHWEESLRRCLQQLHP